MFRKWNNKAESSIGACPTSWILQDESSNYNPFENGDLEEIPQECQVDSDHGSDEELLDILG